MFPKLKTLLLGIALLGFATHGWTQAGTLIAWGDNRTGQTNVPSGLSDVVAISSGEWHNLALRANGTVVAWGDNRTGQIDVPPGLSNVVAIAAAEYHNLVLKSDGTVTGWGWNRHGQTTVPAGLNNAVAIAAGNFHSLALRGDGTPSPNPVTYVVSATASQGTVVSRDGRWPFYAALNGGRGLIVGWITFDNTTNSSLDGRVHWVRPTTSSGVIRQGFHQVIDAIGSLFISPPSGVPVVNWVGGAGTAELVGGNLSGSFRHPVNNRNTVIRGATFQRRNALGGFFLGQTASGYVVAQDAVSPIIAVPESLTGRTLTFSSVRASGTFNSFDADALTFTDTTATGSITGGGADPNFGAATYDYEGNNVGEVNMVGSIRGRPAVIRTLLFITPPTSGYFLSQVTAGGSGVATGQFTLAP